MTITQNVDPEVYYAISSKQLEEIRDYIQNPMTATTINDHGKTYNSREIITSEIIYYWMKSLEIPFECEKWHLNRLLTFIRVCNIKDGPQKKMSKKDTYGQYKALNEARRKQHNTRG